MEDFFEELQNRPRPDIFRRIYLWWKFDGRYYHKYFKQGIKNLWYWLPIIWKDRSWDDHYIFEVLEQHSLGVEWFLHSHSMIAIWIVEPTIPHKI